MLFYAPLTHKTSKSARQETASTFGALENYWDLTPSVQNIALQLYLYENQVASPPVPYQQKQWAVLMLRVR